jgi:hypothetical protein
MQRGSPPKAIIHRVTIAGRRAGAAVALCLLAISCSAQPGRTTPGASTSAGHGASASAGQQAASSRVLALNQMSTLRVLFNRAGGHVRLVLIFSPT